MQWLASYLTLVETFKQWIVYKGPCLNMIHGCYHHNSSVMHSLLNTCWHNQFPELANQALKV